MRLIDAPEVMSRLDESSEVTINVTKDEHIWDPASTKHTILGPAEVTYKRFPDGGVHAIVRGPGYSE